MPFQAKTYQILIASPSDVAEEREVAVSAIQEWNDQNSADRRVVLLPLRWETHSAPEYGQRPQEILNRQVVDNCDLLVGIFWTRIGTHTGQAVGGTVEEIERAASQGKKVMLYFSKAKHEPDGLDLEQLAKLRQFKEKTLPNALIESYSSMVEFKEKLSRQLDMQVKTELAELVEGSLPAPSITDIVINFGLAPQEKLGTQHAITSGNLELSDFDKVPDLESPVANEDKTNLLFSVLTSNKDFYRQTLTGAQLQVFFKPFTFWLKNRGSIGARDVYIDLSLTADSESLVLLRKSDLSDSQPTRTNSSYLRAASNPSSIAPFISQAKSDWNLSFEINALQPQRELVLPEQWVIGATKSCKVSVQVKIYADTLPQPSIQNLTLTIEVKQFSFNATEFLGSIIKDFPQTAFKTNEELSPSSTNTIPD